MNNIRIFGWHPPEIPEFYQYCDEAGLTVWQDVIPLGTANISQDEAFVERIYAEAERVKGDTGENLIGLLERRLDAVVYRAKLVPTVFAVVGFALLWSVSLLTYLLHMTNNYSLDYQPLL